MKKSIPLFAIMIAAINILAVLSACEPKNESRSAASATSYWDNNKGNCDSVLRSSRTYSVSQISECMKLWEMYRYVDDLDIKERSMYAVAFSKVSHLAPDPYDRMIADQALARICIPRYDISGTEVIEQMPDKLTCNSTSGMTIGGQGMASNNPYLQIKGIVKIPDIPDKDVAKSHTIYKRAGSERKKNQLGKAIKSYEEALEVNPYNVAAKYDLACALAVKGDRKEALKVLEELYKWDDYEAEQRLTKARSDEDLEVLRSDPNFKFMTGYIKIAVINAAGSAGQEQTEKIKEKLIKKNFPVASTNVTSAFQTQPVIYYRAGFDDYADQIKSILGIQNVKLMAKPTSDDDILVYWGERNSSTLASNQKDPIVQGKSDNNGTNVLDSINGAVDGVKGTSDNIQKTGTNLTTWK